MSSESLVDESRKAVTCPYCGDRTDDPRSLLQHYCARCSAFHGRELCDLVRGIAALLRTGDALGKGRAEIRRMGLEVHKRGGLALMRAVATELQNGHPRGGRGWHPADLGAAWHGVGSWTG